jgi:hypothetical protein
MKMESGSLLWKDGKYIFLWRSGGHMLAAQKEGEQYEQDEASFHVYPL